MASGELRLGPIELDRAVGVVVACAAGDALGSAYEFGGGLPDEEVPQFGRGVFGHEPGEWTDDTSMAVPILEALARGDSLCDTDVLAGITERWLEWSATAKDVGAQTRAVLSRLRAPYSEVAAQAAARAVHERSGRSAGNGALMRTGPVALGFLADGEEDLLVDAAGRIVRLTHHEQDNVDAVVLWCLAIRHAVRTGELDVRVGLPWVGVDGRARWAGFIDEASAVGSHPRDFRSGNGWVVRAFQGALAAVSGATNVAEALARAVRGGGDTDTVAAIAGSLAGAVWGATQVPLVWQRRLHGWPGYATNDLTRLAVLAAWGGRPDSLGWPSGAAVPSAQLRHTFPRRHPHDSGVWLGSQSALTKLPSSVGAVVSLCRVGVEEIPERLESVRVWLVDQPEANANLDWTLADATDVIAELRSEGTEVFVHCAEARGRTAAVAALYSIRHRGVSPDQAWTDVERVLSGFAPGPFHRAALVRLSAAATAAVPGAAIVTSTEREAE